MITPRFADSATTARWLAVTAALDHDDDAIIGPSIACRIGCYQLRFFGTGLTPFFLSDAQPGFHGSRIP